MLSSYNVNTQTCFMKAYKFEKFSVKSIKVWVINVVEFLVRAHREE